VDGAPMALFATVDALDFGPRRAWLLRDKLFRLKNSG
jgi:hypothetical protein